MANVDLEVYSFDQLGGENDLAGYLDEDFNDFNDETFGDVLGGDANPGESLFLSLDLIPSIGLNRLTESSMKVATSTLLDLRIDSSVRTPPQTLD
jgi:hypothetical protein